LARSRKPRPQATGSAPQNGREESGRRARPMTTEERMARGYARGRQRDAEARAKLKPLAPGERPLAVTLSAILAAALGLANVTLLVAGYEVDNSDQSAVGAVIFAVLMAAAAVGLWQCRYWAVLGFEALLGIAIIFAALSLMVASNAGAVLLCLAIIAIASPLFWFLIRAMARIQLPSRRPHEPVG
jgi:anti-sigma factor RsiW